MSNQLLIVTPCHDGMYHSNYVSGIEEACRSPYYGGSLRSEGESDIGRHRSKLASRLVTDPQFSKFKHVLWVDADIGFTRRQFERIASLPDDLHIVGGVYVKKNGSHDVVARGRQEETWPGEKDIVRRDCIGCGFMRTSMEVLRFAYNFLEPKYGQARGGWRPVFMGEFRTTEDGFGYESEDYAFCLAAHKYAIDTWLDRSIRCTHRGFQVFKS